MSVRGYVVGAMSSLEPVSPAPEEAPPVIAELADACVRFVESAVGLRLDFQPETLAVLDHYLATRRAELLVTRLTKPEMLGLVARAAGSYFGEVVRRRFRCSWHIPSDDPSLWELRFEPVYLALNPVAVVYDAITLGDDEGPTARLELDDEDRDAVEARLSQLPPVTDEEFSSLSTRLEVLEIAVEAIKARMMSSGLGEVGFSSIDYERD
jgi:hypothetical protein